MLKRSIDSNGVLFMVNYNDHDLHFNEWSATDDCIYYFPLATLVDNGYAKASSKGCIVPFENIYLLDDDDKMLLGIPNKYDKAIRLRGDGMLNTPDFKYKMEFLTSVPDGELFAYERGGNIIICKDKQYLLSEAQYELLRKVEDYNCQEDETKTTDFNLRCFAEIKELALQARCELDSYLSNENVYVPEKIKIEVGADEEGFTIDPSIDIEENDKFKRTFDRMRKVQGQYPLQRDNGERVRVVLNPEQKANLGQLKQTGGRHRTREQIKELTEHPTELFDPDVFDLSELYSDRVIEIGIYKPKFYPFICPYKSCWIAGATVETPENGTTKINICDEVELAELKECIKEAEDGNKTIVDYKNAQMDIEDARFLANTAEKQLKSPDKPVKTDDSAHKVLIIEENAEEVGFAVKEGIIERGDKYTLFKNPFLKDSFALKEHQEEGVAWLQHLFNLHYSWTLASFSLSNDKKISWDDLYIRLPVTFIPILALVTYAIFVIIFYI